MIYTSYLANPVLKHSSEKYFIVGIMRYSPSWYKGLNCTELAPSASSLNYLKQTGDSLDKYKNFIQMYIDELKTVDVAGVLAYLTQTTDKDIVLCCYETSDEFCHRHILAGYCKSVLGIEISEL